MDIVLWGATGQAVVLRELFGGNGESVVALFDNDADARSPFTDVPLYYGSQGLERWLAACPRQPVRGVAAIGGDRGKDRVEIQALFASHGIRVVNAIHRAAFVSPDARLGEGVQVLVNATVCARAFLGDAVIVNSGAIVEHECEVQRGSHVGPGAVLAGRVVLEEFVFVGAGAVVLPRIRIGAESVIGAGAVVTKGVPPGSVVTGSPARPRRVGEATQ